MVVIRHTLGSLLELDGGNTSTYRNAYRITGKKQCNHPCSVGQGSRSNSLVSIIITNRYIRLNVFLTQERLHEYHI